MSGENFYNRQNLEASKLPVPPPLTAENIPLMVNGAIGADALPSFATLESGRRRSDGDSRPPDPATLPSATAVASRDDERSRYGPPLRSRSQPPQMSYTRSKDEYGNAMAPPDAYGPGPGPPGAIYQQPEERRGPGPYREDGFRPRGGYPSRGSYGSRGGYSGPRGPPPSNYRGRGGYPGMPQRGYSDRGRGGLSVGPMATATGVGIVGGAMANRGQRPPPPSYPPQVEVAPIVQYARPDEMRGTYYPQPSQPLPHHDDQTGVVPYDPVSPSDYGPSPVEPIAPYGLRGQSPVREPGRSPYGRRQQSPAGGIRRSSTPPPLPGDMVIVGKAVEMNASNGHMDPGSVNLYAPGQDKYVASPDTEQRLTSGSYVPPRAGWTTTREAATVLNDHNTSLTQRQPPQPPIELVVTHSNSDRPAYPPSRGPHQRVNSGSSDVYYEDVNPRFAAESNPAPPIPAEHERQEQSIPHLFQPGGHDGQRQFGPSPNEMLRPTSGEIDPVSSCEDLQQGTRSPAESEASNFTSVSQRGVNPNWRPGYPGEVGNFGPGSAPAYGLPGVMRKPVGMGMQARQEQQNKKDLLFAGNPDFEIPGMGPNRSGRGGGVGGGMRAGGGQGRILGAGMGPSAVSGGGDGRYPTPGT